MTKAKAGMIEDLEGLIASARRQEEARIGHYAVFPFVPADDDLYIQAAGQLVLKTRYPKLYAKLGILYGGTESGDMFGIPDARGRVIAGADNMGGSPAARLTDKPSGVNGLVIGATGGREQHTITLGQMARHRHNGNTNEAGWHDHDYELSRAWDEGGGNQNYFGGGQNQNVRRGRGKIGGAGNHWHTVTTEEMGGNEAHNNVQPTIIGIICIYAGE